MFCLPFHNFRISSHVSLSFQVEEYKNDLISKAEALILKGFPEKIVQLNELLATPMFNNRDFADMYQDLDIPVPDPILVCTTTNNNNTAHEDDEPPPSKRMKRGASAAAATPEKPVAGSGDQAVVVSGTKVMALPNGLIKTNQPICDIIKVSKPVIRKLVEDCECENNKSGEGDFVPLPKPLIFF